MQEDVISYKIALLGSSDVGKTALAIQYTQGLFKKDHTPTLKASHVTHTTLDGIQHRICLLDTAGDECYSAGTLASVIANADAVAIVFSLESNESFDSLENYISVVQKNDKQLPYFLIANKNDLDTTINMDKVQLLAQKEKIQLFVTSAKNHLHVEEIFNEIVQHLDKKKIKNFKSYQKNAFIEKDDQCCILL